MSISAPNGTYAAWNRALGRPRPVCHQCERRRPHARRLRGFARALDEHPVGLVYADLLLTRIENETFATTGSNDLPVA